MPPSIPPIGRLRLASGVICVALGWIAPPLAGQDLPLQREIPGEGDFRCPVFPPPTPPTPEGLAQAARLSSEASQVFILGQLEQAESLYGQAAEADPTSADFAYNHGRSLQGLGRVDEAMSEFCRAISMDPGGPDVEDADRRLDELYEIVRDRIPEPAKEAFRSALIQADSAFYAGAVSAFTVAIEEAPLWATPLYNRAVMYEYLGLIAESLADYRTYLDVAPFAVDPIVVMVSERIGLLEGAATGAPSPSGAFALGILPGMGQFYTRRPVSGTVVLLSAAGAIAAGVLVKEVTVECLNPVTSGQPCPANEIVDETTERPFLLPAVGAAAAVTVIGALEALIKARRRRAEAEVITGGAATAALRLEPPNVTVRGDRVELNVLRLSFR